MIGKFLEAMDEEKEYDFIANNYNSMSKYELRSILLEYIYAAHRISGSIATEDEIQEMVRDELESREVFE